MFLCGGSVDGVQDPRRGAGGRGGGTDGSVNECGIPTGIGDTSAGWIRGEWMLGVIATGARTGEGVRGGELNGVGNVDARWKL